MRTLKQLLWILCLNSVVVFAASTDKEHYIFERLWPTLPQPWHFDRAYDLAVDQQGNVYVLNQTTRLLQKFTSNGHFIHQWHFENDTPLEVEIGNSGNIYILYARGRIIGQSSGLKLIRVLNAEGELICEWGEIKEGQHRQCSESLFPSTPDQKHFRYNLSAETLAVDSSDHLYIFEKYDEQDQHIILQKFTPDGRLVRKWPLFPPPIKKYRHVDIAISEQNELYVVYQGDALVFKYQMTDKNLNFIQQWDDFIRPEDIVLDSHDNVYVVDRGNFRIVRKLASDNEFEPWVFSSEIDIDLPDEDDFELKWFPLNFIIESPETYSTFKNLLPDVSPIRSLFDDIFQMRIDFSKGPNQFFMPWAIAIGGPEDHIYITTHSVDDSVQRYTPEGKLVTEWKDRGSGDGQFYAPFDIARDSQGYLYVTDAFNHRVLKFTENGQFIKAWGKTGFKRGQFVIPTGITVDKDDNIYVADTGNLRIQKFNSDGLFLAQWAGIADPKALPADPNERLMFLFEKSEFLFPIDVAVDSQGNLYVIDLIRNHVKKMSQSGQIDEQFAQNQLALGYLGDGQGELKAPVSLTIDPYDNIYVSDTYNHRIQQFTKNGNYVDQWGQAGNRPCQFYEPLGITSDAAGYLYIFDTLKSTDLKSGTRIQKLKLTKNQPCQSITEWGEYGTFPGQFGDAYGLAVSPDGDRVFLADTPFNRIQVFKQGIFNDGKAIIVAGGGPGYRYNNTENNLWTSTQTVANFAYRTLAYQGFTQETMYYLSNNKASDIDGNGENDDIDDVHTKANLKKAITEWASDAENLTLYFTDHGGIDTFSLNDNQAQEESLVKASELAEWLDFWHEKHPNGILKVIYDACHSGSFIPALSGKNRIIITSSTAEQSAYFLSEGALSFSNSFWTHIFHGVNLKTAFAQAQETITKGSFFKEGETQTPQMAYDVENINQIYIGNGTQIEGEAPIISNIDFSPITEGTLSITADVYDDDAIDKVWAVIIPPNSFGENSRKLESPRTGQTILELPFCDFQRVEQNHYQADCEQFTTKGQYNIAIYARDRAHNTAIPQIEILSNDTGRSRKAIILVAGSEKTLPRYQEIAEKTKQVYEALQYQGYDTNDIQYLVNGSVSIPGVEMLTIPADRSTLFEGSLTGWAIDNTLDLVLYIIGLGDEKGIVLNEHETLSFAELKKRLDELQDETIPGPITVIYEGPQSAYLLPALALEKSLQDKKRFRFLISSAGDQTQTDSSTEDKISVLSPENELLKFSFSELFWQQISNGTSLYPAFYYADDVLKIARFEFDHSVPSDQLDQEKKDSLNKFKKGYTLGIGIKKASQPRTVCLYELEKKKMTSCQTGDNLQVILPPLPENQVRYLGIQLPNEQLFLIPALNEWVPFDRLENLPVWRESGDMALDIKIEATISKGEYHFYWLDRPKGSVIDSSSVRRFLKESVLYIE